jgi:hypothetical protein
MQQVWPQALLAHANALEEIDRKELLMPLWITVYLEG